MIIYNVVYRERYSGRGILVRPQWPVQPWQTLHWMGWYLSSPLTIYSTQRVTCSRNMASSDIASPEKTSVYPIVYPIFNNYNLEWLIASKIYRQEAQTKLLQLHVHLLLLFLCNLKYFLLLIVQVWYLVCIFEIFCISVVVISQFS